MFYTQQCPIKAQRKECFLYVQECIVWRTLSVWEEQPMFSPLMRIRLFPPHKNSCKRSNGAGSALGGCGFLSAFSWSERKLSSRADLWAAALPLGSESLFESSSPLHKKAKLFLCSCISLRFKGQGLGGRWKGEWQHSSNVLNWVLGWENDNKHTNQWSDEQLKTLRSN